MLIRPVAASGSNCARGFFWNGNTAKPQACRTAGLRPSSRNRDSLEGCWNTTPARSAFHIAGTG